MKTMIIKICKKLRITATKINININMNSFKMKTYKIMNKCNKLRVKINIWKTLKMKKI
jgi:hypothetical protein